MIIDKIQVYGELNRIFGCFQQREGKQAIIENLIIYPDKEGFNIIDSDLIRVLIESNRVVESIKDFNSTCDRGKFLPHIILDDPTDGSSSPFFLEGNDHQIFYRIFDYSNQKAPFYANPFVKQIINNLHQYDNHLIETRSL